MDGVCFCQYEIGLGSLFIIMTHNLSIKIIGLLFILFTFCSSVSFAEKYYEVDLGEYGKDCSSGENAKECIVDAMYAGDLAYLNTTSQGLEGEPDLLPDVLYLVETYLGELSQLFSKLTIYHKGNVLTRQCFAIADEEAILCPYEEGETILVQEGLNIVQYWEQQRALLEQPQKGQGGSSDQTQDHEVGDVSKEESGYKEESKEEESQDKGPSIRVIELKKDPEPTDGIEKKIDPKKRVVEYYY